MRPKMCLPSLCIWLLFSSCALLCNSKLWLPRLLIPTSYHIQSLKSMTSNIISVRVFLNWLQ